MSLLSAVVLIVKLKHNVNIGKHFNSFLVIQSDFYTLDTALDLYFCRLYVTHIINRKEIGDSASYLCTRLIFKPGLTHLLLCAGDNPVIEIMGPYFKNQADGKPNQKKTDNCRCQCSSLLFHHWLPVPCY